MNIKDFKVGDHVIVRDYHYRSSEENATMTEMVVVKVGTKKVTVEAVEGYKYTETFQNSCNESEFFLEACDGHTGNKLFKSEEDFNRWKEGEALDRELREIFSRYGGRKALTLDQKKRIKAILDET